MQKNVASQKWVVFAFDDTDLSAKTGDAANITANLRIDGGAANAVDDTNPTELEDGYYIFDITQAESNGDYILMCPASSTANIQVIGCPAAVWTNQTMALVTTVDTVVDGIQTDLSNATDGLGALKALIDAVTVYVDLIDDATNGLAAIKAEVEGLAGAAMRGTDSAALASSWTAALATILANFSAARIGYLDELAAANLPTDVAAIPTTAMRGTDNVVLAGPTKAEMDTAHGLLATPAQVATALTDIHLDHLLAVAYDPASKPGVADALLNELIEDDGGVSRYTTNALEQAPSGGGGATLANQATLIQILTGRWKIIEADNQFVQYDSDGVTPLYTYDLKDIDGAATHENPYERVPV